MQSGLTYAFYLPTEQLFSNKLQFYKEKLFFPGVFTEASIEIMCIKDEYCIGFRRKGQL